VPVNYRYCELGWEAQASACLRRAEDCRRKWRDGAATETARVFARAKQGDPRYRKMTDSELRITGQWRWRLSTSAIQLARSEEKQRERARLYLEFGDFRRRATSQLPERTRRVRP
jgi:hypothetical protein